MHACVCECVCDCAFCKRTRACVLQIIVLLRVCLTREGMNQVVACVRVKGAATQWMWVMTRRHVTEQCKRQKDGFMDV